MVVTTLRISVDRELIGHRGPGDEFIRLGLDKFRLTYVRAKS